MTASETDAMREVWKNIPPQYMGRWSFDYDEKQSTFFVYNNGYRICDAEDSEVADAICKAYNAASYPPAAPVLPVAPDVALIEAAIRGGEHATFLKAANDWIESADRCPAEITDEKIAGGVAKTISELIKARTGAEKIHAGLKKPWFDVTKTIDAIFLTGIKARAEVAQKKLEAIQKKYLVKKDADARAVAAAESRRLEEAALKLREEEALRLAAAERTMDKGDMEGGNALLTEAVQASDAAAVAEQGAAQATDKAEARPADLVRTHHAIGVTTSARAFWAAELLPLTGLDKDQELTFWRALAPYIGPDVRLKAAKAAVKAGLRECPGIKIFEDFNPINR